MCGDGSNLFKTLEKYTVARYITPCLNNCFQTKFFQTNMSKFKKHISFSDHCHDKSEDEDEEDRKSKNEQNEKDLGDDETNHQTKSIKFNSMVLD